MPISDAECRTIASFLPVFLFTLAVGAYARDMAVEKLGKLWLTFLLLVGTLAEIGAIDGLDTGHAAGAAHAILSGVYTVIGGTFVSLVYEVWTRAGKTKGE